MSFAILPAAEIPLAEQAGIANRAFAGYVAGWHDVDATTLARFLSLQGADIFFSRFVVYRDTPVGFGFINHTGDVSRLAGMALEPHARGTGAAAHLLRHLWSEAKIRGESGMLLEVIEQNSRAHAFYRREGFRELTRLCGWRLTSGNRTAGADASLEEISLLEATRAPAALDYPEVPWQITRYAAARLIGARAFRGHGTCVVISNPDEAGPIRLHSVLSPHPPDVEPQRALALFPEREFFIPAIFPEAPGAQIFPPLGFRQEPLRQFLMRRDL